MCIYSLKITAHSLSSELIGDTAGLDLPQIKKTTKNRVMKLDNLEKTILVCIQYQKRKGNERRVNELKLKLIDVKNKKLDNESDTKKFERFD